MSEGYPVSATDWGGEPIIRIVLGEGDDAYNADLFYVDGFTTYPTIYNTSGAVDESFDSEPELVPATAGTNGVNELQIGGKNFIVYSNNQHTGSNGGNELFLCELGEGMAFEGMAKYWQIPAVEGLGMLSDGGTRIHCIDKEYIKDDAGKEGALLLTFKTMNGMGVYQVAEEGFGGVNSSLEDKSKVVIVTDGNVIKVSEQASVISIYDVTGKLIDETKNANQIVAPEVGVYIVKAVVLGKTVTSKIVL